MGHFASIREGRDTWSPHCSIPRHRHERAYAAVILSGGYQESGSLGRFSVGSGHVLLHRMFDAHVDRFESQGAQILNLLLDKEPMFGLGIIADPDVLVRAAEDDAAAAACALWEQLVPVKPRPADWPDLLAQDLLEDPRLRLEEWAERHGLAPATVSRGFGKVFATSPGVFRAEARAHRLRTARRRQFVARRDCRRRRLRRSSSHDASRRRPDRPATRLLAQVKRVQDAPRGPPL